MMPIALEVRGAPHLDAHAGSSRGGLGSGEWAIIHRCTACGALKTNRIAGDDSERTLLALALRPLANPAFPLDGFRQCEQEKRRHKVPTFLSCFRVASEWRQL
jgi:hypothetical protein